MAENSELTPGQKEFMYRLQLLREKGPLKADLYYYRELRERNQLRLKEGRPITVEEKRAILDGVVGMSDEEVMVQLQLIDDERERKNVGEAEKMTIRDQEEQIRRMGGRTFVDHIHEVLEEREASRDR